MLKGSFSTLSFTLAVLTANLFVGYSQDPDLKPVRLMFYNVENLFDVFNDTIKDDDDFLPHGVMRWNFTRYDRKIKSLYKTIIAAGEWSPPEIVAFCEVENRKVLNDLVHGTSLSKFNYQIIHEESPDLRGIDVCLIYRNDLIGLIDYCYWIPSGMRKNEFISRSILYAKMLYYSDTIHLIVNHWPSRRGGVLAGESHRIRLASMVREKTDSINKNSGYNAKIILLGDFNCTPDDKEMKSLVSESHSDNQLINLSESLAFKDSGTYRYSGTWEMIDQIIVSGSLLTGRNGLSTDSSGLRIFKPDFLLTRDPKYPGFAPFATYKGFRYQGGFSDHLPVLLILKMHQDQLE